MKILVSAAAAAMLSLLALPASADAPMTAKRVLSSAESLDGKMVSVRGTVKKFAVHNTSFGTVTTFGLCEDDQCVAVLETKSDQQKNGDSATVAGTFHASYTFHGRALENVIVVSP